MTATATMPIVLTPERAEERPVRCVDHTPVVGSMNRTTPGLRDRRPYTDRRNAEARMRGSCITSRGEL